MSDNQNHNTNISFSGSSGIDRSAITVHTMKEDLEALKGKHIKVDVAIENARLVADDKKESKLFFGGGGEKKVESEKKTSPFLSGVNFSKIAAKERFSGIAVEEPKKILPKPPVLIKKEEREEIEKNFVPIDFLAKEKIAEDKKNLISKEIAAKTETETSEKSNLPAMKKEKSGFWDFFRKRKNQKLIEGGEKLRRAHNILEKKNNELKKTKVALEEGIRKHLSELKTIKENEEKIKNHLAEMKKNETDIDRQVAGKNRELKQKTESLKLGFDRQINERNNEIKEKIKKLEELNVSITNRERQLSVFREKIAKTEKEIAAKEVAAKAKLEELEKEAIFKEKAIKDMQKKTNFFGFFGKKTEKKENQAEKNKVPEKISLQRQSFFMNKNKTETENMAIAAATNTQNPFMQKQETKTSLPQKALQTAKPRWGSVLAIASGAAIILIILISGYIFLKTRNSKDYVATEKPQNIEPPTIEVAQIAFSEDKPNYFNIDIENASKLTITQSLISVFVKIKEAQISAPVEFLTVDENNNPIPFSVFAEKFGFNIPADILNSLGDNFSLFAYADSGNERMALAIDLKNKNAVTESMFKNENTLGNSFQPIFLGNPIKKENFIFKNGQYGNISVRYINLDSQNTLSFDYAFTDDQLIIGTSKNVLRAALDKINKTTSGAEDKK